MAAAVVFPADWIRGGLPGELHGLNDSKQLSPRRRDAFFAFLADSPWIQRGLALVDSEEIDRINILQATHAGMVRALAQLDPQPQHVLVDGLPVARITLPQTALVRGDSLSYSIAAASVLAKVTRDRWMLEADRRWPEYGFAVHKGYPTPQHQRALERHGPCPIHRRSFAPVRQSQRDLFS